MAKQTFTAGQVLTAAQMNSLQANDYNWTVDTKTDNYTLVAGDAGKRIVMNAATAKTITVNTSIFTAGDVVWLHNINTGTATVTAGTATVTTAGSLAIPQWGGGALFFTSASAAIYFPSAATVSPFVFISTATFSGAATVSMPASTFTSTYRTYLVILRVTASAGDQQLTMRVNNAGSPRTTGNYTGASSRAYTSVGVTNSAGATSFNLCTVANSAPDTAVSLSIMVYDPTSTSFKTNWSYTGFGGNDSNQPSAVWGGGVNTATAENNDGLTFIGAGPSNITGSYIVYGVRDS